MDPQTIALRNAHGYVPDPVGPEVGVGLADNVRSGQLPVHGLRLADDDGQHRWYIWAGGDMGTEPDFFKPVCATDVIAICPLVERYLELPVGWRFMVAPGFEDVWYAPVGSPPA